MLVRQAPDVRSSEITDERHYWNRREWLRTAVGGAGTRGGSARGAGGAGSGAGAKSSAITACRRAASTARRARPDCSANSNSA